MPQSIHAEPVLHAQALLGEGPVWHPGQQVLVWVDISRHLVHRFDPHTGTDLAHDVGQPVGAVAHRERGGLVLALRDGFASLDGDQLTFLAAVEADRPDTRMNDGAVDPAGRFWAGTMAFDMRTGAGSLYRLDPDLSVRTVLTGLTISNGIGWSPDHRLMYFIDTPTGGVDVFDYDQAAGTISGRRRFIATARGDGLPDGLTVDADGCVWVAFWGGWAVRRYTPRGVLDLEVRLPVAQVTNCTFGGRGLDNLYITTASEGLDAPAASGQPLAGDLFSCRPGVSGLAPFFFRG